MAKVLFFDDDVLRKFLKASMKQDGCEVHKAGSQSRVRRANHDTVFSDIERPFSLNKLPGRLKLMGLTRAA